MRITGSCDIRIVVPSLVPSGGSPLSSACLMPPPYSSTLCPVISSLHLIISCLVPCRLPLRVSARASPLLRSVIDVGACAATVPWRLATRPASSTRRTGRYDGGVAVLSALPACPLGWLAISSMRFGIGWRRGSLLASLDCPPTCSRPMSIIGAVCYPLARPIRFPCRPAAPSSHRFPPRSLDTRDGAGALGLGCLSLRFYFVCCLFVLVLCIAVAWVALLAWLSYYVCCRWGDAVARRFVSGL